MRLQLVARDENVQFDPKIWIFWTKSHFFLFWNRDFCFVCFVSPVYPGLQLSHSDHPEKISVSELWVILPVSCLFFLANDKEFDNFFEVKILEAYKKPFIMCVEEGTYIANHQGELLNSKSEWHQPKLI